MLFADACGRPEGTPLEVDCAEDVAPLEVDTLYELDCAEERLAPELEIELPTEPLTVPAEGEEAVSATELVELILGEEAETTLDDATTEEEAEAEDEGIITDEVKLEIGVTGRPDGVMTAVLTLAVDDSPKDEVDDTEPGAE